MDKENMVHICHRIPLKRKEYKMMSFAGKWMELEIIMLSEIN
jgi:hypothetical protein